MPDARFGISVLNPGGFLDLNRLSVRPETALKINPERFLQFADACAAVARRYREATAQVEMDLTIDTKGEP